MKKAELQAWYWHLTQWASWGGRSPDWEEQETASGRQAQISARFQKDRSQLYNLLKTDKAQGNVKNFSFVVLGEHLFKIPQVRQIIVTNRPGVDKVKPKVWFKYSL